MQSDSVGNVGSALTQHDRKMHTTKPAGMNETHFRFLDNLQSSGETNMMGAGPYLQTRFGLDRQEAREFVLHWMDVKENEVRPC